MVTRKTPAVRIACSAAFLVLALALVPVALAGKPAAGSGGHKGGGGGSTGGGTISLVLVNSSDGLPHWGQTVTFNISTTATTQPWVNLQCYQNGVLVGQGWNGFFVGSLTGWTFTLASPQWTGGAADCTANLETPQWAVLASTSFHVYA
jgi:hypothetical protein